MPRFVIQRENVLQNKHLNKRLIMFIVYRQSFLTENCEFLLDNMKASLTALDNVVEQKSASTTLLCRCILFLLLILGQDSQKMQNLQFVFCFG